MFSILFIIIVHLGLLARLIPHLPTAAGVVYYVRPTEPCSHSGSCPSGTTCHTMDYYASNSSHYFSPHDHVNVTLYFICGVHNCTKHMHIQDLQTFTITGTARRQDVTINMPLPTNLSPKPQDKGDHIYSFMNVSYVRIELVTINYISVSLEGKGCKFVAKKADFHGYIDSMSPLVSVINISGSQALLDNCTFQHNSFIRLYSSAELTINDCTFQSYNHVMYSAVGGRNSTLTLSGTVYFVNNTVGSPARDVDHAGCGGAMFLSSNNDSAFARFKIPQSILNIPGGSCVYFINNTSDCGGALHLKNAAMNVGSHVTMTFNGNKVRKIHQVPNVFYGGALLLQNSFITFGTNASLLHSNILSVEAIHNRKSSLSDTNNSTFHFINNTADFGGAICIIASNFEVNDAAIHFIDNIAHNQGGAVFVATSYFSIQHAVLCFVNNSASSEGGGAIYMRSGGSINITKHAEVNFINNWATLQAGGAIFMSNSNISISEHAKVNFINNRAALQGGAIYHSTVGGVSIDTHSCLMFNNNSAGTKGGALYLTSSASVTVGSDSIIEFFNNSALGVGGAIFADFPIDDLPCFLVLTNYSSALKFQGNLANNGSGAGMHIYGASIRSTACEPSKHFDTLQYCGKDTINISFVPNLNDSLSPVSSDPKRVCLCDLNGHPQCANLLDITLFTDKFRVYSGEPFNLSLVVVGHDFGVTTGPVHANLMSSNGHTDSTPKLRYDQYHQWTESSKMCTNITYSVYSTNEYEKLYLQTTTNQVNAYDESGIRNSISLYNHDQHGCLDQNLLTTPVFINVTLIPGCPPGFTLQNHLYGCNCYSVLKMNLFNCFLINNEGYLKWNSTMWVNSASSKRHGSDIDGIVLSQHCPLDYCTSDDKVVDLGSDPDSQCAYNHAGVLCGGCKVDYSLAIGSSRCIRCSSDSYLALVIFFFAAGFLLVIFILALNLTVTEGLINGLIFYANIVWACKGILFPSEQQYNIMFSFQVFIAWLNLDFGIEVCFAVGLTAFWKTLLQFLFPLYVWVIAGVIIIVCRYSSRLTNLIGERAVPLLATLFLLSYMKVLRTAIAVLEFGILTRYPDESKTIVWYLDGNLLYCQHPHIYLFIISVVTLVFLCLPFTLFLLLIQCWRKISHWKLLRWINKYTPVYDAYLAPLKDKHHYWFGALLLVRGLLLVTFTLTSATLPTINLPVVIITMSILLSYMSLRPVYKRKVVRILEIASILNLIVLGCTTLYTVDKRVIFLELSIGVAFVQFCVIILISLIKITYTKSKCTQRNMIDQHSADEIFHERIEDPGIHNAEMIHHARNTIDAY